MEQPYRKNERQQNGKNRKRQRPKGPRKRWCDDIQRRGEESKKEQPTGLITRKKKKKKKTSVYILLLSDRYVLLNKLEGSA
jgi:hypothetical protein